jgi:ABC-type oligopeptide transport system substrate-binding subunit
MRKYKLKYRCLPTLLACIALLLTAACSEDRTINKYSLRKVDPKQSYGHEWLTLNPTTYRIETDFVVSETVGILIKHNNCTILSKDDWECRYNDYSGSFGFRNGQFWELPLSEETKTVSRWRYNVVRCEWAIDDESDGLFWGTIRCVVGWE